MGFWSQNIYSGRYMSVCCAAGLQVKWMWTDHNKVTILCLPLFGQADTQDWIPDLHMTPHVSNIVRNHNGHGGFWFRFHCKKGGFNLVSPMSTHVQFQTHSSFWAHLFGPIGRWSQKSFACGVPPGTTSKWLAQLECASGVGSRKEWHSSARNNRSLLRGVAMSLRGLRWFEWTEAYWFTPLLDSNLSKDTKDGGPKPWSKSTRWVSIWNLGLFVHCPVMEIRWFRKQWTATSS